MRRDQCGRQGSYSVARLGEKLGAEIGLVELPRILTARCPWQLPPAARLPRQYERRCLAYLPDLQPADEPERPISKVNKALGQPIIAAFVVTIANAAIYLAAALFVGIGMPSADKVAGVPWWAWFGGVLGGLYVLAMIFVAERVGSAVFTGLTVTAAIITSVALDHFGLVGFEVHSASIWRLVGAGLMVAGLAFVCAF